MFLGQNLWSEFISELTERFEMLHTAEFHLNIHIKCDRPLRGTTLITMPCNETLILDHRNIVNMTRKSLRDLVFSSTKVLTIEDIHATRYVGEGGFDVVTDGELTADPVHAVEKEEDSLSAVSGGEKLEFTDRNGENCYNSLDSEKTFAGVLSTFMFCCD
jgi:hypothetical protein